MSDQLPAPVDLGAPGKFATWRPYQQQAVRSVLERKGRFLVQVQPTGSGKSLCYVMAAVLSGLRVLLLTSTRALQDQVLGDFGKPFQIADVRGQSSYVCLYDENLTVEEGPCHSGVRCELKEGGCLYYDALRKAKRSAIVLSNYAFWMTSARKTDSIGQFDLLVLDEAHDAPEWVMKVVAVSLGEEMQQEVGCRFPDGTSPEAWVAWAGTTAATVDRSLRDAEKALLEQRSVRLARRVANLRRYARALENILLIGPGNMVVDRETAPGTVLVDPVSAVGLAERLLFRGTPAVLLTSASVREKTLYLMGIAGGRVEEYPSRFPAANRPVIHIPTLRMNHKVTTVQEQRWVAQMDNIIRDRLDRKGIIHSVSYQRAKTIVGMSEYRDLMILHDTRSLRKSLRAFREAPAPRVLVSPSITTGYDFPYDQAEYQIISKVPFPDSRTTAYRARAQRDPEYLYYATMQTIVQACGRGMRSADDRCEVFVVDDHWQWFLGRWRRFAPQWFLEACRTSRTIPKPPPLVKGEGHKEDAQWLDRPHPSNPPPSARGEG